MSSPLNPINGVRLPELNTMKAAENVAIVATINSFQFLLENRNMTLANKKMNNKDPMFPNITGFKAVPDARLKLAMDEKPLVAR